MEAAKNVLRRCGKVVYGAEIDEGRKGRGIVRVDGLHLTEAEVVKQARAILEREAARNRELAIERGLVAPKEDA